MCLCVCVCVGGGGGGVSMCVLNHMPSINWTCTKVMIAIHACIVYTDTQNYVERIIFRYTHTVLSRKINDRYLI